MHGGWARGDGDHLGDVQFNAKTSEFFRKEIQFPFFEHYLKGKGEAPPEAYMFETGTNVWRKYRKLAATRRAAEDALLPRRTASSPSMRPPAMREGLRRVRERSDASGAVRPLHHRHACRSATWWTISASPRTRPDVLVYQTDPLTEDVTIAGPISPKLKIASSGTDSDFVVKLIDVYPERLSRSGRHKLGQQAHPRCRRRCTWAAISRCCAASRCAPSSATAGKSRSR